MPINELFVVDDEIFILHSLDKYLSSLGFQVRTFPRADEVLVALEEHVPDAIIADYYMPGMNGLTLLQYVHQSFPHVYRIIFTGGEVDTRLETALDEGEVQLVVQKPFKLAGVHGLLLELPIGSAPRVAKFE